MIKRSHPAKRTPPMRNVSRLIDLATRLNQSSCRIEDQFWEVQLAREVNTILETGDESALNAALDQLYNGDAASYGNLVDVIESCAECTVRTGNEDMDILLFAVPILAWSRLPIPASRIKVDMLDGMRAQLHGHVLAKETKLCLADCFFSPDQLPQSYCETRELIERFADPALHGKNFSVDMSKLPETATFLSDTRFLLGAIAINRGAALFRWQEEAVTRADSIAAWQQQAHDLIRNYFPACAFEPLAPTAYHSAIRELDRASRPYSLVASIDFLKTILAQDAAAFQATLAGFHSSRQLEEYRIGFGFADKNEILHGVVWPILDPEDESPEALARIEQQLSGMGVARVNVLRTQLPLEFCDDCGAPLFPDPQGEATHAEMPAEADTSKPHQLH